MLKWLSNLYHALTQPTAGGFITQLKARAERDWEIKVDKAKAAFDRDMAHVEAVAHQELTALENQVEHAQARIKALLDTEIDLGERNVAAAMLHLNLTKAVK